MKTDIDIITELYADSYIHTLLRNNTDPDDLDDIVQESVLATLQAVNRYKQAGEEIKNPKALLRKITLNTHASYYRRKALQPLCVSLDAADEEGWQIEDELADLARNLIQKELEETATYLLNRIYHKDARILKIRFILGASCVEIANKLKMPPPTVRAKIWRALQHIRGDMDRFYGYNIGDLLH